MAENQNSALRSLALQRVPLSFEFLDLLLPALPALRTLSLAHCSLNQSALVHFFDMLQENPPLSLGLEMVLRPYRLFGKDFLLFLPCNGVLALLLMLHLIDAVMDKFGEDVSLTDRGDGTAQLEISVQISPAFLAWCCAFGDKLKVVYPKTVVASVKKYIANLMKTYDINN